MAVTNGSALRLDIAEPNTLRQKSLFPTSNRTKILSSYTVSY